jgi:hypothetical protein
LAYASRARGGALAVSSRPSVELSVHRHISRVRSLGTSPRASAWPVGAQRLTAPGPHVCEVSRAAPPVAVGSEDDEPSARHERPAGACSAPVSRGAHRCSACARTLMIGPEASAPPMHSRSCEGCSTPVSVRAKSRVPVTTVTAEQTRLPQAGARGHACFPCGERHRLPFLGGRRPPLSIYAHSKTAR